MRGPRPPEVVLTPRQRGVLERIVRSRTAAAGLVERCRILLLAADNTPTAHVAATLGVDRQRVRRWRQRWATDFAQSLAAQEETADDAALAQAIEHVLSDRPRSGAPPRFSAEQIAAVEKLALRSPADFGIAVRWTRSSLARVAVQEGIVESVSVAEIGRWVNLR